MPPDFPAAHSMDTTWFAVDRDGHVACFNSGETGAVPVEATQTLGIMNERLAKMLPQCETIHNLEGRRRPGNDRVKHCLPGMSGLGTTLMFLKSLEPVRESIEQGQAEQVRSTSGVAVMFAHLAEQLFESLHASKACLGCFLIWEREDLFSLPQAGFFEYGHLCDNWISGPYGRESQPARPIHVDQLPPMARTMLNQFRFDSLCFNEATYIQPVEHADCDSREVRYLTSDGKTEKPIPGHEEEFDDDDDGDDEGEFEFEME